MKKLYLSTLFFIGYLALATGQDLILDHPVFSYSGPSNSSLSAQLTVVNQSANTLDVICQNDTSVRTWVPGHQTFFCWYVCYDTSTVISPDSIQLAPGQSTSAFYDHVIANGISGHDDMTYRFYDQSGNSTDTLSVTINYDFTSVGVFEVSSSNNSFKFAGPNPANSSTVINYYVTGKQDAKLIVSNMLGSKVKEIPLNLGQNSLTLSVKDMKAGIYIYSLYVDGKIMSSKKLVVAQH